MYKGIKLRIYPNKEQKILIAKTFGYTRLIYKEHIANQRYDFLQKETLRLCKENQFIAVEDLNIKNMQRNHYLAKDVQNVSWSKFITILQYKCNKFNTTLVKIPRFYASSQICSCCEYKNRQVKNLSVRKWTCPKCSAHHDRDVNAAINILNKALNM